MIKTVICILILIVSMTWPAFCGFAAQDGALAGVTGHVRFYGSGPVGSKRAHILDIYAQPDLGTVYISFWSYNAATATWSKLKPNVALGDSVFTVRENLPVRFIFAPNAPDAAFLSGTGRADLMWE